MDEKSLHLKIEREYKMRGDDLGWRFLYSPVDVLKKSQVAFIGLNPGGNKKPTDHAEFATVSGSAYEHESWTGHPPGESPLQQQVLALFERVGVPPEQVLAGNLVPFRSPTWAKLKDSKKAMAFGKKIWKEVLENTKPELIITMGRESQNAVADLLNVSSIQKVTVSWGNIAATKGKYKYGRFVGLPHLSRFGIMMRPESTSALDSLFS